MSESTPGQPPVTAVVKPARRLSLAWIIPAAALLLALGLAWRAWSLRGTMVTIVLEDGHGLREGDSVRYRGIVVGQVRDIELADDLQTLHVKAAILQQASRIARAGTRFWVVRPRIGLDSVGGLETLMGPRYLEVEPGVGSPQREFVGLREPPIVPRIDPGDLEIILEAADRGSLRPGAPVTYRGTVVGRLLSVGLTSDGGAVESRAVIFRPFTPLIRAGTQFWDSGGARADFGWTGMSVNVDSLSSLVSGSVALATPGLAEGAGEANPGPGVRTGHRFIMAAEMDEEWMQWQPQAVIGMDELPPGAAVPQPLRAKLTWKQGRILQREKTRHGWVLLTSRGLLGPSDLLMAGEGATDATVSLEAGGQSLPIEQSSKASPNGLALLTASISKGVSAWPDVRCRVPNEVEDCLVVGDPSGAPLPLAAARFTVQGDQWLVDPRISVDESWHGACVLSRADGKLIGLLLVDDDGVRVGLLSK